MFFLGSKSKLILQAVAVACALCVAYDVRAETNTAWFSREVLPILSEFCFQCHGPDEQARKGHLRLDTREGAFQRNKKGVEIITPSHPESSELIRRIVSSDPDEIMPPPKLKRALSRRQIETLTGWIQEGATWGRHWAFEPVTRPVAPSSQNREWPRNAIDRFVLARLEHESMPPSPEAPRETLIRRLSLDLLGLPPTLRDVESFVSDDSPSAYEHLVERLLASPHFGERMTWDWLDAARYADSNGYQGDGERTMWPWRDWVVKAFNENLPFNQFTRWQLSGDLLPHPSDEQRLATGFCRNHMINGEGGRIPEENRVDYVMDMTETVGTVWLGLTLNCCRCHDHKFDPLTQREYYQLSAFFNQTPVTGGGGDPQTKPVLDLATSEQRTKTVELAAQADGALRAVVDFERLKFKRPDGQPLQAWIGYASIPKEIQEALLTDPLDRNSTRLDALTKHWKESDASYVSALEAWRRARDEKNRHFGTIPRVMIMEDRTEHRPTFVLTKGLYDKPREPVEAGTPASLPPFPGGEPTNRLGLAQWIVSANNPLMPRVVVNRFWQQFFGVGLVKTSEDFGVQGEKPIHGELLDWLAFEFTQSGGDIKALCRLIVSSSTYRQSSKVTPERLDRDPQNRFISRGARFRMPSWMLRDQALGASGLLVTVVGGSPVNPYQPQGVWEETTFGAKKYVQGHGEDLYRRSLYTFWRRIVAPTIFFDNGSRQTCNVKQPRTNTPLQALTTLNDVTYLEAARALAARVLSSPPTDSVARIEYAVRSLLARAPSSDELRILLSTLTRSQREFEADPQAAEKLLQIGESPQFRAVTPVEQAAFTVLCGTLLNLDETLNRE